MPYIPGETPSIADGFQALHEGYPRGMEPILERCSRGAWYELRVDYKTVYRQHPAEYDELVRAEDANGNLATELNDLIPLKGVTVAEVGAGTGRLTRILLDSGVAHVDATELEPAMLGHARVALQRHQERVRFVVADARSLPIEASSADLAIAGWVFGHFRSWIPDDWKTAVGAALGEMERVTRAGGSLVIIETLGTGSEEPAAPSEELGEYYEWLETMHGFARRVIRTDYQFRSIEEAARITGLFFGDEFAERVKLEGWMRVPECTGIWSRGCP